MTSPPDTWTLPNGAVVIESKRYSDRPEHRNLRYVLCEFRDEYVTWRCDTRTGECLYGRYFGDNWEKAWAHYRDRNKDENVIQMPPPK